MPMHRRLMVALAIAAAIAVAVFVPPTFGLGSRQRMSAGSGGSTRGGVSQRLKVGGAVKPPTKLVDVKPVYPEDAREAGIEGSVILEIAIGEEGSVIEAGVIRSIPELDQAAIDAVSQWKYEPTLLNGEPVEIEMNVSINFTLR
jgi:TonB family protein